MIKIRKASFPTFLIISVILSIGANIAHPFTPELFRVLEMPDYMFGLAFSLMAFTSFLFAPTWGNKSDSLGRIKIMCFCIVGYAMGQLMFSFATSMFTIICARLMAGTFSGGWTVMCIVYVTDLSTEQNRGKYMSIYVAIQSLSTALGFFFGGLIADKSIRWAFNLQVSMLLTAALLFFIFLKDSDNFKPREMKSKGFENPLKSFYVAKDIINSRLIIFFVIVMLASFCTQALDNSFNYYLNAELGLMPSYNGTVKAIIGISSLVANFSINMWIVKNTNWHKTLTKIFAICSVVMMFVVVSQSQKMFVGFSVICFILNSIFLPLMQSILTIEQRNGTGGILAGLYHSFMYFGKVIGPLMAGILYGYGSKLPFIAVTVVFVGVTILGFINAKQFLKER